MFSGKVYHPEPPHAQSLFLFPIVFGLKGEPCCFFVSRRARALVCLDSPKKKKKKKKDGRALSAIALSRPSPAPECRTRPMQQVQLLRMLHHRLRLCSSRSPALRTRLRFLTLICSLVESDQLWFQRRRRTGEAARNRTVPMIAHGG